MLLGEVYVQIVIVAQTVVMAGPYAQQHVVGALLQTVHKVTSYCLTTYRSYILGSPV